jgi:integrase
VEPRRGIYEKVKGSKVWWIRYTDGEGKKRREKAGAYSAAQKLLNKRHTQVIEGVKIPGTKKDKPVLFSELCADAIRHSQAENSAASTYNLQTRIDYFKPIFGSRPAESIRKFEIVDYLGEQAAENDWKPATYNRWKASMSLIFRVGIDNEKITKNPAAGIRRKTEDNGRVRFLTFEEEAAIIRAIDARFPQFREPFLIGIYTGMRMSEQYTLQWSDLDMDRKQIHLSRTKNGNPRTISMNSIVVTAFESIRGDKIFGSK